MKVRYDKAADAAKKFPIKTLYKPELLMRPYLSRHHSNPGFRLPPAFGEAASRRQAGMT